MCVVTCVSHDPACLLQDGAIPMDRDQMNVLAEWMGELDDGPELTGEQSGHKRVQRRQV